MIGEFPSFSITKGGETKHYFRKPENDMAELAELEASSDPEDQRRARRKRRLLGYKKYERQMRRYLGRRDYCKYCYGNRYYDIDWWDGVIDCRNCGYHIESIEMIIGFLIDDHIIPDEPASQPLDYGEQKT